MPASWLSQIGSGPQYRRREHRVSCLRRGPSWDRAQKQFLTCVGLVASFTGSSHREEIRTLLGRAVDLAVGVDPAGCACFGGDLVVQVVLGPGPVPRGVMTTFALDAPCGPATAARAGSSNRPADPIGPVGRTASRARRKDRAGRDWWSSGSSPGRTGCGGWRRPRVDGREIERAQILGNRARRLGCPSLMTGVAARWSLTNRSSH